MTWAAAKLPEVSAQNSWCALETYLDEIRELRIARSYQSVDLVLDLPLVGFLDGDIPLRQASFSLAILQQEKADLQAGEAIDATQTM